MLGNVGLHEDDRVLGIDSGRDKPERHVPRTTGEQRRVIRERDRVQVDDTIQTVKPVLEGDPVTDRAEPVTDMQFT
jgi:hypothetical protein